MIGFLFQERERLPGELRGRFERLGGASLWLLAPLLLVLGTPPMAEGLRLAVRDFLEFVPYLAMAVVAVILVLEEWAVPWRVLPRGARYQRVLGGVLAAALLWLFAWPLQLVAGQRLGVGDRDGALLAGLLILPLLWMLVWSGRAVESELLDERFWQYVSNSYDGTPCMVGRKMLDGRIQ